jgi:hypothetical protein
MSGSIPPMMRAESAVSLDELLMKHDPETKDTDMCPKGVIRVS